MGNGEHVWQAIFSLIQNERWYSWANFEWSSFSLLNPLLIQTSYLQTPRWSSAQLHLTNNCLATQWHAYRASENIKTDAQAPKKRKPTSKSTIPQRCPCKGTKVKCKDRKLAFKRLVESWVSGSSNLKWSSANKYAKDIMEDEERIFSLPFFCMMCQKVVRKDIIGVVEEGALKEDRKEKKSSRSWNVMLGRCHLTWDM